MTTGKVISSPLRKLSWIWAFGTIKLLAACSDGDVRITDNRIPALPAVQSGVFKDSNVAGLDFESGNENGITDALGRYRCETGQSVTFSIGAVVLGEAPCTTLTHPASLRPSGSLTDPEVLNIVRLLLTLDSDQDPSNGITVSDGLRSIASTWPTVNFATADLDGELVRIVSDISTVDGRVVDTLPSSAEAFTHLQETLGCAYAGVFRGILYAPERSNEGTSAILVFPEANGDLSFDMVLWRGSPFPMFVTATGTMPVHARPDVIDVFGGETAVGEFITPDNITGTWRNPGAIQILNERGSFNLLRIGSDTGTFRFVGEFAGGVGFGFFALSLEEDRVIGEAVRITDNRVLDVDGTVTGDSVELRLSGSTDTATTATITRDASGAPAGLSGPWPGGGQLSASGCRLN